MMRLLLLSLTLNAIIYNDKIEQIKHIFFRFRLLLLLHRFMNGQMDSVAPERQKRHSGATHRNSFFEFSDLSFIDHHSNSIESDSTSTNSACRKPFVASSPFPNAILQEIITIDWTINHWPTREPFIKSINIVHKMCHLPCVCVSKMVSKRKWAENWSNRLYASFECNTLKSVSIDMTMLMLMMMMIQYVRRRFQYACRLMLY